MIDRLQVSWIKLVASKKQKLGSGSLNFNQVAFSLKALSHVTGALMSSSHSCVSASKRELDYKKAAAALSWIRSSRELGPPRGQSRAR